MFKNMGLRGKLLLSICTILFLSLTVSISIISIKTYHLSKRLAMEKTEAMAALYATEIQLELDVALNSSRTLADVFAGLKSLETLPDRNSLSHMIKEIVVKNPGFDGVWTVWEPNALDGKDQEFAGTEGHDETGRFIHYWNRTGGLHVEPCVEYEDGTTTGYYTKPRATGKEVVMDPVTYAIGGQQVTVVSTCVPIMVNNKFVGLTGHDFSMVLISK